MVGIEAELKAVVRDVDALRAALDQRAPAQMSSYADRYFDYSDHRLTEQGRELRVRTITEHCGRTRVLLTYKEPVADAGSGTKREHETTAEDADVLVTVLTALGVEEFIAFEKQCVNYRFTARERDLLATVVTVPELEGQTFIELETMTDADEVDAALDIVRSVLRELGVSEHDLTTETYTDAVAAQRRG
jgi:adenylate cyclase, class 2